MFFDLDWFKNLPPEVATLLFAMLPVFELRGAIPIALKIYQLNIYNAYFWAVLGNIIPIIFILWILGPISGFLRKHFKILDKFFIWLFRWTRRKHNKKFEKWGELALIIFVAIPLPITGGWSGALAAFVFGIPFRKALPLIVLGVLIAGVIVTLFTAGIIKAFWLTKVFLL